MNTVWALLKETFSGWNEDDAPRLAAALAFYTVFALAPLLVIVVAIAGLVFGEETARGQIIGQIEGLVGTASAEATQDLLEKISQPESGFIASAIGVATFLIGAWFVFGELQNALDAIWGVKPRPGRSILAVLRERFVSFTMMLGIGFLLLVSLVISAALAGVSTFVGGLLREIEPVLHILNFIISFGVITVLFAMIYKILPDVQIRWNDVWIGAATTSLLYTIGKFLIGLYLGKSSVGSAYGAAGSLVIILVWVYYASQILFFGAEFTKVYAKKYGSRIVPAPNAVPITAEAPARDKETWRQGDRRSRIEDRGSRMEDRPSSILDPRSSGGARRANRRSYDRHAAAVLGFIAGLIVSAAYGTKN